MKEKRRSHQKDLTEHDIGGEEYEGGTEDSGPKHTEKRVIARQESGITKSEKHKDIQDLERRMAQVRAACSKLRQSSALHIC